MMFNEENPESQLAIDPTYLPQNVQWAAKYTGWKPSGELNDWGKAQSYIPGFAIAQKQFGKTIGNNWIQGPEKGQSDFYKNAMDEMPAAMARTKVGLNAIEAGVGAYTGNPQLMQAGVKGLATNIPQTKGGADLSDDWKTGYYAAGGPITPAGSVPPALNPNMVSPWLRHRDPTMDEIYQMRMMNRDPALHPAFDLSRRNMGDPRQVATYNTPQNLNYQPVLPQSVMPPAHPLIQDPTVPALKKGGVMKKGEDILMTDKWTGQPVGEVSYGERIMDKTASQTMKELADKKKYLELGKYVAGELQTQSDGSGGMWKKGGTLTAEKAKLILKDGTIRGKAITEAQKRFFGWIAGGGNPDEYQHRANGGPIREIKRYATGDPITIYGNNPSKWTGGGGGGNDGSAQAWVDKMGGWEQLFNIGQLTTGLMGARDKLPVMPKSDAWTQYLMDSHQRAKYGMSNAEYGAAERNMRQGLTSGLNFARENSGGNSSFAVGDASRFAGDFMEHTIKLAELNNRIKGEAIDKYGRNLLTDIGFDKEAFDQKYKEAMLKKSSAAELARTGLQNMIDQYDYNKNHGPGSLDQEYLKSMIDLNKRLGNMSNSGWIRNIINTPGTVSPDPRFSKTPVGGQGFAPANPWGVEGSAATLDPYNSMSNLWYQ